MPLPVPLWAFWVLGPQYQCRVGARVTSGTFEGSMIGFPIFLSFFLFIFCVFSSSSYFYFHFFSFFLLVHLFIHHHFSYYFSSPFFLPLLLFFFLFIIIFSSSLLLSLVGERHAFFFKPWPIVD